MFPLNVAAALSQRSRPPSTVQMPLALVLDKPPPSAPPAAQSGRAWQLTGSPWRSHSHRLQSDPMLDLLQIQEENQNYCPYEIH